jgi:hypothetical protein
MFLEYFGKVFGRITIAVNPAYQAKNVVVVGRSLRRACPPDRIYVSAVVNYPTARSRGLSVALIWSARLQDNTEPLGLFTEPPTSSITFEPFSCFIAMIVTMPTLKRFATPIRLAFGRMNVQALVASLRSVCRIDGNQFNP